MAIGGGKFRRTVTGESGARPKKFSSCDEIHWIATVEMST